jgi:hypothetical protein
LVGVRTTHRRLLVSHTPHAPCLHCMSWSCYISVLLELVHIIQQANVGVAHLQRCSEIDFKTRGLLGRDNFHTLHEFETKNSHAICKSHQDIIKQRNVKKKNRDRCSKTQRTLKIRTWPNPNFGAKFYRTLDKFNGNRSNYKIRIRPNSAIFGTLGQICRFLSTKKKRIAPS